MAEEKWTVVGRRRAARMCRSRSAVAPPLQAEECNTTHLLLRMKRSIDRVQDSAFFQQFLLQVQRAPVCHLLSRAASTLSSQTLHHLQDAGVLGHEITPRDELFSGSADRFGPELGHGNHDASFPMRNSNAGNGVVCSEASFLYASRVQVSDCSPNVLEAGALNASLKALNDTNGSAMNCKCTVGSCRNDPSSDAACSKFSLQEKAECRRMDVVLYGLGSIADSEASRCQLALILLLKERFSWVGAIEVYDPVLSCSECEVIKELGCLPVALDEKGRRSVDRPTLFYMPHCEDWLYDNLLQANWVPCTLRQIVILGNSFQDYQERWSSLMGRKSARPLHVLQYQQIAKEVPLEATCSSDLPGFNNMSWHFYDLCSTL